MANNDFKPFAIAGTANVIDLPSWLASTSLANGFVAGYAKSDEANRAIRQPSFLSAGLAEWVNRELVNVSIDDNGNLDEWIGELDLALRTLILSLVRRKATSAITVYVSAFTGNDANNGQSTATPFRTIQRAVNYCVSEIDLGPWPCTVLIEGGAGAVYNESLLIGSSPMGLLGLGQWQFQTYNGQVAVNGPQGYCMVLSGGAQLTLNGQFLFSCSYVAGSSNGCLVSSSGSRLGLLGNGTVFGNSPNCKHLYSGNGGEISNHDGAGSYTIAGGALMHWLASGGSIIIDNDAAVPGRDHPTITLQNTPNFTAAFAQAGDLGVVFCPGLTFLGTGATGTRYYGDTNAIINTFGAGASYLPGSAPGSVNTGAQYV